MFLFGHFIELREHTGEHSPSASYFTSSCLALDGVLTLEVKARSVGKYLGTAVTAMRPITSFVFLCDVCNV